MLMCGTCVYLCVCDSYAEYWKRRLKENDITQLTPVIQTHPETSGTYRYNYYVCIYLYNEVHRKTLELSFQETT